MTMSSVRLLSLTSIFSVVVALALCIPANADVEGPAPMVRATVTAKMGDLGGKFFGKILDPALERHYYIAVEPELRDYAPQGRDVICGQPFLPNLETAAQIMKPR